WGTGSAALGRPSLPARRPASRLAPLPRGSQRREEIGARAWGLLGEGDTSRWLPQDVPHLRYRRLQRRLRSRPEGDDRFRPAPCYFLLAPRRGEVRADRHHAHERANEGDIVEECIMDAQ